MISRLYTKEGEHVYDQFDWEYRTSEIKNKDGSIVFKMDNVEVPVNWSQTATDILAQKYLRKHIAVAKDGTSIPERSARHVVHRMALAWKEWALKGKYLEPKQADVLYDEAVYMLLAQIAAPNSPQWFNTGLFEAYGLEGEPEGHWYVDHVDGKLKQSKNKYERTQAHACFILSIEDNLLNENGIYSFLEREARIFKKGSGSGANFSKIRGKGEKLSKGGVSSGLMSFLKIPDVAAGAIKSGGESRRSAKMVCLDVDHPEILDFINWKKNEEKKAQALINAGYDSHYEGEVYTTISGQNSNNSVRLSREFWDALDAGKEWKTTNRTDGKVHSTHKASDIWKAICEAAWSCADPGLQFDDTIQEWHTCPNSGKINASNPCSEYMFLDDTACNLASINLRKFYDEKSGAFDYNLFFEVSRFWGLILEISVCMAHFPSKEIAENSYNFRTLGLGFANLGSTIMAMGLPYDCNEAREFASEISSQMSAAVYDVSADIAKKLDKPFRGFEANRLEMSDVLEKHWNASISAASKIRWEQMLLKARKYGLRNAQATVIAPTGTIGLIMDCDTTGIEPEFSLVKYKKLSGGGGITFVNKTVPVALKKLGYNANQIADIEAYIAENYKIEGAPHINDNDLAVFDCAVKNGDGERYIRPDAHVKMMAACQPFISGAISKTINMPNEATVEDVSDIYKLSYKLGLKAVAIYRDGCKASQPLNNTKKDDAVDTSNPDTVSAPVTPFKRKLPTKVGGYRQKAIIDGIPVYLHTGEYEDGSLGEIFIDIAKEGSTIRALLNSFAISISVGLQSGVPLQDYVEKFTFTRFEPAGLVYGDDDVKNCTSILDWVFRHLAVHYLGDNSLSHKAKAETLAAEIEQKKSDNVLTVSEKVRNFAKSSDAPACRVCGHITRRNGSCYICPNCGTTTGCS